MAFLNDPPVREPFNTSIMDDKTNKDLPMRAIPSRRWMRWFTELKQIVEQLSLGSGFNLTASRALVSSASGELDVSATTATELGYSSGVTSAIQTQFNTISAAVVVLETKFTTLESIDTVTISTVMSDTQHTILANATGGAINITLPAVSSGKTASVKKIDTSANPVTVVGTIDGDANFILYSEDEYIDVKSNATTWWIST